MSADLSDLSDSPASYRAVLALVALDAVFPGRAERNRAVDWDRCVVSTTPNQQQA